MTYPVRPVPQDVIDLCRSECGEDAVSVLDIVSVETHGVGCEHDGEPVFLCESAKFDRWCPADRRAVARRTGLATGSWDRTTYRDQGTLSGRRAKLARMVALDPEAAYRSISMGLGQIMGENFASFGYGSAAEMWQAFHGDLAAQVDATHALMVSKGTVAALERNDYAAAARGWNGPGYKANAYDAKLAEADAHWDTALATGQHQPTDGTTAYGLGSSGQGVRNIQQALADAGIPVKVDGIYGPNTVAAIGAFQARRGLPSTNGVCDQATADALVNAKPLPLGAKMTMSESMAAKVSGWRALRW